MKGPPFIAWGGGGGGQTSLTEHKGRSIKKLTANEAGAGWLLRILRSLVGGEGRDQSSLTGHKGRFIEN